MTNTKDTQLISEIEMLLAEVTTTGSDARIDNVIECVDTMLRDEREKCYWEMKKKAYIREINPMEPAKMSIQTKSGWLNLTIDFKKDFYD